MMMFLVRRRSAACSCPKPTTTIELLQVHLVCLFAFGGFISRRRFSLRRHQCRPSTAAALKFPSRPHRTRNSLMSAGSSRMMVGFFGLPRGMTSGCRSRLTVWSAQVSGNRAKDRAGGGGPTPALTFPEGLKHFIAIGERQWQHACGAAAWCFGPLAGRSEMHAIKWISPSRFFHLLLPWQTLHRNRSYLLLNSSRQRCRKGLSLFSHITGQCCHRPARTTL